MKGKKRTKSEIKEYNNVYNKENTTTVLLRLNKKTENDIIKKLDEVQSKNGYIKALIRYDITKKIINSRRW